MGSFGKKIAVLLAIMFATPAHAYLDPGTGSMVLQGVLAAIATMAFTFRLWWGRLLTFLHIRKSESEPDMQNSKSAGGREKKSSRSGE